MSKGDKHQIYFVDIPVLGGSAWKHHIMYELDSTVIQTKMASNQFFKTLNNFYNTKIWMQLTLFNIIIQ